MKQNLDKMIASSGFEFSSGFSKHVMESLENTFREKDTSAILNEKIARLFYWVNVPLATALLALMFLYFMNSNKLVNHGSVRDQVTLNDYVYNFYIKNE